MGGSAGVNFSENLVCVARALGIDRLEAHAVVAAVGLPVITLAYDDRLRDPLRVGAAGKRLLVIAVEMATEETYWGDRRGHTLKPSFRLSSVMSWIAALRASPCSC